MSARDEPLQEAMVEDIYLWIDQIPLSRPKRNFARDFSDGAMVAEVIAHYFPRMVEIHNYPATTVTKTKLENWATMSRKVLSKLDIQLSDEVMKDIAQCKPFVVERLLVEVRQKIDTLLYEQNKQNTQSDAPEVDQYAPPIPKTLVKIKKVPVANAAPAPVRRTKRNQGDTSKLVSTTGSSVVARWMYEQKDLECRQQADTLMMLQTKVQKMEQLLELKDLRIEELQVENQQLKKANKIKGAKSKGRL